MWKLSDILLKDAAKLTNTTSPHSAYINAVTYPEQINDLIRSVFTIKYKSHYCCNLKTVLEKPASKMVDGHLVSLRPEDDHQFLYPREMVGPDFDDSKDYEEQEVIVLRADAVKPYIFIGMTTDYSAVIISSTEFNDMMHYRFLDDLTIYPIQYNEFFDLPLQTHYMDDNFINDVYYDAKALRIDKSEPCKSVLVEFLENDIVRFVLGDEVTGIDNVTFDPEHYISEKQVQEYRETLLEGKTFYGEVCIIPEPR